MQNRTRNKQLNLKFTEEEIEYIKNAYRKSGKGSMSDFIILSISKCNFIIVDTTPLLALATEISRIGNNINQIAKKGNMTGFLTDVDVYKLGKSVSEIKEHIHRCLKFTEEVKGGKHNGLLKDNSDKD
ncbi:MAG: plasmid mobilization relaxosome protein MobC [Firmicutes bacterium]|nr:plasmid mobilization relaxosome protein MobC [Bacillota bacterium]